MPAIALQARLTDTMPTTPNLVICTLGEHTQVTNSTDCARGGEHHATVLRKQTKLVSPRAGLPSCSNVLRKIRGPPKNICTPTRKRKDHCKAEATRNRGPLAAAPCKATQKVPADAKKSCPGMAVSVLLANLCNPQASQEAHPAEGRAPFTQHPRAGRRSQRLRNVLCWGKHLGKERCMAKEMD